MSQIQEVLPKQGLAYKEKASSMVLCKPKLMALKSVTLQRLETMQKDAQDQVKAEEQAEREASLQMYGINRSIPHYGPPRLGINHENV